MSDTVHEGGCLCGDVRYQVTGDPDIVVVCHCTWCQRRTGTAFAVIPKWEMSAFELTAGMLSHFRSVNEFGRVSLKGLNAIRIIYPPERRECAIRRAEFCH
ncbi:MAG: hypothetical protein HOI95_03000 [Chromatiales bacterium]|jgi:hypothetical protein|nr:hypothetical protein [Chromatiales bacterium]